jgi:hypothetical protein
MTHIGWMINVTKILPKLFNDNYYGIFIFYSINFYCGFLIKNDYYFYLI